MEIVCLGVVIRREFLIFVNRFLSCEVCEAISSTSIARGPNCILLERKLRYVLLYRSDNVCVRSSYP